LLPEDERVKVMSPGMMVYKRFVRNKLAITGLGILAFMFLFSFLGGFLYPYRQEQVFKKEDYSPLDYASATYSTELRFTYPEGVRLSDPARAAFFLANSRGETGFESGGVIYRAEWLDEDFALIGGYTTLVEADGRGNRFIYANQAEGFEMDAGLQAAFEAAYNNADESFQYRGETYRVLTLSARRAALAEYEILAIASRLVLDAYEHRDDALVASYDFRYALETAIIGGQTAFSLGGVAYTVDMEDSNNGTVYGADGEPFAALSNILISPALSDIVIPLGFIQDAREAIVNRQDEFYSSAVNGVETRYSLWTVYTNIVIKTDMVTELITRYEMPSPSHPFGTDENGMDVLARLMYGGRISLTVGFVVILIELMIGVTVGGISGYFSGWVDTALMRFVDLFNTIPEFPMLIILASIMDANNVDPQTRIYFLMALLGLMGWTGVARVVRGQILSLREQDFMVAAEATGIKVSRRIFRHLVPNVMPLLIVNATMGLGGIIITEATLSFLGLGIRYPMASWGSIVSSATNTFILGTYPNIWMSAGFLIFLTVLGFNFVGDGLRDAYDPKMKR
jgi:peptide/nickel transport system permease protein